MRLVEQTAARTVETALTPASFEAAQRIAELDRRTEQCVLQFLPKHRVFHPQAVGVAHHHLLAEATPSLAASMPAGNTPNGRYRGRTAQRLTRAAMEAARSRAARAPGERAGLARFASCAPPRQPR